MARGRRCGSAKPRQPGICRPRRLRESRTCAARATSPSSGQARSRSPPSRRTAPRTRRPACTTPSAFPWPRASPITAAPGKRTAPAGSASSPIRSIGQRSRRDAPLFSCCGCTMTGMMPPCPTPPWHPRSRIPFRSRTSCSLSPRGSAHASRKTRSATRSFSSPSRSSGAWTTARSPRRRSAAWSAICATPASPIARAPPRPLCRRRRRRPRTTACSARWRSICSAPTPRTARCRLAEYRALGRAHALRRRLHRASDLRAPARGRPRARRGGARAGRRPQLRLASPAADHAWPRNSPQRVAAISNGRDAIDRFNAALLDVARTAWPDRWTEPRPAPDRAVQLGRLRHRRPHRYRLVGHDAPAAGDEAAAACSGCTPSSPSCRPPPRSPRASQAAREAVERTDRRLPRRARSDARRRLRARPGRSIARRR